MKERAGFPGLTFGYARLNANGGRGSLVDLFYHRIEQLAEVHGLSLEEGLEKFVRHVKGSAQF